MQSYLRQVFTAALLKDTATCYPAPAFKEKVGAGWTEAQAVVDGNVVTSMGPGTSLQFALKLVEILYDKAKAEEIAAQAAAVGWPAPELRALCSSSARRPSERKDQPVSWT